MSGPLEGLKVLDIATIIAAPSAAALLADYGADVLKIELPGVGDGARGLSPSTRVAYPLCMEGNRAHRHQLRAAQF